MKPDALPYRGNLEWLRERAILVVTHGSHAYGLNTPTSDLDIKGVAIPPREYFHGFAKRFEQAESKEPDMVIYDIRKFFALAADCNPNIIEVVWGAAEHIRGATVIGLRLLGLCGDFLSKKAKHTFSGYAFSQLKRIRTHRRWLLSEIKPPPTRAEMGLPERTVIPADQLSAAHAAIEKKLATWQLDDMSGLDQAAKVQILNSLAEMLAEMKITGDATYTAAGRSIGYDENFLRLLDLERAYKSRRAEWDQYQNWKANRNPTRAALEAKHGYDCKHAMHLVRLMRMCREILTEGKVIVKRPDRDELLAIRNGAWSYDRLEEWAEKQDAELTEVAKTSKLPNAPDRAYLDRVCSEMVEASLS